MSEKEKEFENLELSFLVGPNDIKEILKEYKAKYISNDQVKEVFEACKDSIMGSITDAVTEAFEESITEDIIDVYSTMFSDDTVPRGIRDGDLDVDASPKD